MSVDGSEKKKKNYEGRSFVNVKTKSGAIKFSVHRRKSAAELMYICAAVLLLEECYLGYAAAALVLMLSIN